jgi:hypothetical protein
VTAKKPSKKAVYESFVGRKYIYKGATYAVGQVLPDKNFAVISVSNGYGEHYFCIPCAAFVKGATLVEALPPVKCDGMGCEIPSGYLTSFDGYDLCPVCLLVMATETCEDCGALEDGESAAFVGDHILCRDCYNMKDDEDIARLKTGDEESET